MKVNCVLLTNSEMFYAEICNLQIDPRKNVAQILIALLIAKLLQKMRLARILKIII